MTVEQPGTTMLRRRSVKAILAVVIPSALLVTVGVGLLVPRLTGGSPQGAFPQRLGGSKDPGIAACEGYRDIPKRLSQIKSGRPGESHPRAPTDPRMSVSAHGALLTRSSRCWSSIASA